jgi:hypothetical protein
MNKINFTQEQILCGGKLVLFNCSADAGNGKMREQMAGVQIIINDPVPIIQCIVIYFFANLAFFYKQKFYLRRMSQIK